MDFVQLLLWLGLTVKGYFREKNTLVMAIDFWTEYLACPNTNLKLIFFIREQVHYRTNYFLGDKRGEKFSRDQG